MAERPELLADATNAPGHEAIAGHEGAAELPDVALEAVARRVAALVLDELRAGRVVSEPARPLSAREVAVRLGRSPEWVRDHRDELGVLPGRGPRPRLLFDAAAVEAWATARSAGERSEGAGEAVASAGQGRRRRRRAGTDVPLLPIRGRIEGRDAA